MSSVVEFTRKKRVFHQLILLWRNYIRKPLQKNAFFSYNNPPQVPLM